MMDAFATADSIAADWEVQKSGHDGRISFLNAESGGSTGLGWEGVRPEAEQRGLLPTSWQDWERIDFAEMEKGRQKGKVREKFGRVEEMLDILR
jgi:adrenodoxin-NADP+ reductase